MLETLMKKLQSKGAETIEFRQSEMNPFGGMEIVDLYVKFSSSQAPIGLGIVTLKKGFMYPEVSLNEVEAAVSGLIEKNFLTSNDPL
jgi:hypothetical protein